VSERHKNPGGTYDGLGVLSEMSGLTRDDVASIWDEVRANHAKLVACTGHEFSLASKGRTFIDDRHKCAKCGGWVNGLDRRLDRNTP
jgi:hypothetical protein